MPSSAPPATPSGACTTPFRLDARPTNRPSGTTTCDRRQRAPLRSPGRRGRRRTHGRVYGQRQLDSVDRSACGVFVFRGYASTSHFRMANRINSARVSGPSSFRTLSRCPSKILALHGRVVAILLRLIPLPIRRKTSKSRAVSVASREGGLGSPWPRRTSPRVNASRWRCGRSGTALPKLGQHKCPQVFHLRAFIRESG
jgi:hypothetical protein